MVPVLRSRLEQIVVAETLLDPKDIACEGTLAETKWFAYRFISPWAATVRFIGAYSRTFQKHFATAIDRDRASYVRGADLRDFYNNSGRRTQFWRARQRADEFGLPYEHYIDLSFEFALRRGKDRRRLPQPNQLHHGSKAADSWNAFREERMRDRMLGGAVEFPEDPAYRIEHFVGLHAQVQYREFVVELERARSRPLHQAMHVWSVQRRQVPQEAFADEVDEDVYRRAVEQLKADQDHFSTKPDPLPQIESESLWPSCFGSPMFRSAPSTLCASCPQSRNCHIVAAHVARYVMRQTGSASPVVDERRRKDRERQRQHRALKQGAPVPLSITVSP